MFLIENECMAPIGSLIFTFYEKYFYHKRDIRPFYFHVMNHTKISNVSNILMKKRKVPESGFLGFSKLKMTYTDVVKMLSNI